MCEGVSESTPYDALRERVIQRTGAARIADPTGAIADLAAATTADDRAWALVRLAADARASNEPESALRLLDSAWLLDPGPEAERAIFTVAIAAHCDGGRYEVAEILVSEQAARSIDTHFAMAAARLYAALYAATRDDRFARLRDKFFAIGQPPRAATPA